MASETPSWHRKLEQLFSDIPPFASIRGQFAEYADDKVDLAVDTLAMQYGGRPLPHPVRELLFLLENTVLEAPGPHTMNLDAGGGLENLCLRCRERPRAPLSRPDRYGHVQYARHCYLCDRETMLPGVARAARSRELAGAEAFRRGDPCVPPAEYADAPAWRNQWRRGWMAAR